jgi:HSPB1-associated protein 1
MANATHTAKIIHVYVSKMASYVDVGGGGDDYPDLDPLSPKEVQVLKGAAASWKGQEFFLRLIVGDLADTETVFRVCPITKEKSSRANDGIIIMATFREFYEWFESASLAEDHPFCKLPHRIQNRVFVYADYKHFVELFGEQPGWGNWEKVIPESLLGDENCNTLWLGTQGAHTALHYDTYNCNYIAQLVGRKRWLIWRPDTESAASSSSSSQPIQSPRPTRLPYEESSVFSLDDPMEYIAFESCDSPPDYDIILEPGDILVVPKHYWHFVITVDEISLSVNRWCSLPSDKMDRVSEAIVRFVQTSVRSSLDSIGVSTSDPADGWICPSEVDEEDENKEDFTHSHLENIQYLLTAVQEANPSGGPLHSGDEILKTIVNELLSPDNVRRCVDRLLLSNR